MEVDLKFQVKIDFFSFPITVTVFSKKATCLLLGHRCSSRRA